MNIRKSLANFLYPTQKNAVGDNLARDFFKYGPQQTTLPDWSQLMMGDKDKYSGYMYAAITRRANKVAWLATYNLKTHAKEEILKQAKDKQETVRHPYLDIIDNSTTFSNGAFWREIQTFIDLKGDYYLMARRGKVGNKVGPIEEFKIMRPYEITVVYDSDDMNVIGYVETRGGMYREIEPHMIIPIKGLNPFSRKDPFSLADAATDAQFTLKEVTEHMRTTARRNRKYPGVVLMGNGEVALDPEQVSNFKARMRGKSGSGDEPMFASGTASTLSWNDMQVDMRKSAVDMVNEVQLNALNAVAGMSKTKPGALFKTPMMILLSGA